MFTFDFVQRPSFDNDDLLGNPSGSADPTVQPSADPAIQGTHAQQVATQPAPGAAPTMQNQPEPSWLRGRLQETRESAIRQAREQFNQELASERAQREAIQRQLHALVGVGPQEDPEAAAVKAQFAKLFPELADLQKQAKQLMTLAEQAPQFQHQTEHYWSQYGNQNLNRLFDMASKSLGAPVTEDGKRALHMAFSGYVSSSPEMSARYAQDPTVVEEFWNTFESNFVGPARRSAGAQVQQQAGQRMIPQDSPSGLPVVQGPAQPRNLEDRVSQAWAAFNASRQP